MRLSTPNYPLLQFAKRLGELLDDHPLTQAAIAKRLGISPQSVTDYRKGKVLPDSEEAVRALAEAVAPDGADPEDIFEDLMERAWVDQYDRELRRFGHSVEEARRVLGKVAELRRERAE